MQTFVKGINDMGNANSLIQELNSGHRLHFLCVIIRTLLGVAWAVPFYWRDTVSIF